MQEASLLWWTDQEQWYWPARYWCWLYAGCDNKYRNWALSPETLSQEVLSSAPLHQNHPPCTNGFPNWGHNVGLCNAWVGMNEVIQKVLPEKYLDFLLMVLSRGHRVSKQYNPHGWDIERTLWNRLECTYSLPRGYKVHYCAHCNQKRRNSCQAVLLLSTKRKSAEQWAYYKHLWSLWVPVGYSFCEIDFCALSDNKQSELT